MSEPTCLALCCRSAGCLSSVRIYLLGTVVQGFRLFKQCQNLPAGHSVAGVQAAKAVLEPTFQALCCRLFKWCLNQPARHCVAGVQGSLSSVGTYQPGTVLQGCRLVKSCQNLPARHCVAGFLSGVGTYMLGTVL